MIENGSIQSLRQELDNLATQALLGSPDPSGSDGFARALAALSQQAEAAGVSGFAKLAGSVATLPPEELLAGVGRLQELIEQAGSQTAAGGAAIAADPELIGEFVVESRDHLSSIETQMLQLEQDPDSKDAVHSVFRSFHTIKGLAGFLELPAIQQVAHEVETLLDMIRNGLLPLSADVVDVVLAGADYLRTEIARIAGQLAGEPGGAPADNSSLLACVRAAQAGEQPGAARKQPETQGLEAMAEGPTAPAAKPEGESKLVKVDTAKLDFLVDMVGELVIAQSLVRHHGGINASADAKLLRNLSQLSRITAEVQKTAMSMRMVPIGQLFQKSVRLVRDLTRKSGKKAELEIAGKETELDRTIVEALSDPLMHMIRNAADHGIEKPEERVKAGKDATARIGLRAYHQAGHIVVEVSDDGRGLNRDKILAKARERGLVQDGASMADKDVFGLIFEPGFSTAERVTDISGRGVGMDVVKKQVQKLRGRIDIESRPGLGTTFFLKLPLTLAIIDGLVVGVGQERYIIPIYMVREMFRPRAESIFTVEQRNTMVLVRGSLMPVVRLSSQFGIDSRFADLTQLVLVVAECGGKRFCVAVDELIGKQEVVIKNLGGMFREVTGVAGGAILGDGRVGLILDVEGLLGAAANG